MDNTLANGAWSHRSGLVSGWPATLPGEPSRLSDLLQLLGVTGAADLAVADNVPLPVRRLHEGEALFHEGARSEAVHFVRSGTFKTFSTFQDGYEQVLGFAGSGDVLGFDAICMSSHPTAAVALEDSSVFSVLLRDFFAIGQRVPAFDRAVTLTVSRELANRGELANMMAAVAAEVRLARFLMQLSAHMEARGWSPRRFHLRMNRREIASHLGVAHETVSRSFRALAECGLVTVSNREIEIRDMDGLKAFSCSTRRPVEEGVASASPGLFPATGWPVEMAMSLAAA